jgi:hypothetical protein
VTEHPSIAVRTADGTIMEIFEWISQDAIARAHKNPALLDLWKSSEKVWWYETPPNLQNFRICFAHVEPI